MLLSRLLGKMPDDPFFKPRHMTPDELGLGYDWIQRRLFSHASIWRRRPETLSAAATCLASACLCKRSNRLWHFLIKHRFVHTVWCPLVELTRIPNLAFRKRLAIGSQAGSTPCATPVPASV